jgi:hypothetical protein
MKPFLRRGVTTVEFALIAPLGVFLLAMALEVSRVELATTLLERSVYDIAYQAKVAQGQGFEAIVAQVLESRNNGLFRPAEISIVATSSPDLDTAMSGAVAGAGQAGDIVHIQLLAELGILNDLVPDPMKIRRTIDYYYINETDLEVAQ